MRDAGNDDGRTPEVREASEVHSPEGSGDTEQAEFSGKLDDAYASRVGEGRETKTDSPERGEVNESPERVEKPEKTEEEAFDEKLDEKYKSYVEDGTETPENNTERGLTEEEKNTLKAETGWSDEIIDATGSLEEADIYRNANLKEAEVDGKKCLIRSDLDLEQKDEYGRTNRERMADGNCPLDPNGGNIELHHIGQKPDSPLAELTTQEHRGKGNDTVMHDKTKESEINRSAFATERKHHWESRAEDA